MKLVNLPALRLKQTETLSHTALSIAHLAMHPCDAAILFNAANAPLLPGLKLRGIPVALHVDGLEWKRSKWSGAGRRYYQWAERIAVRRADRLIADAQAHPRLLPRALRGRRHVHPLRRAHPSTTGQRSAPRARARARRLPPRRGPDGA